MKILLNHWSDRIVGRTSLHDVYDPLTDELILKAGEEITQKLQRKLKKQVLKLLKYVLYLPAKANVVFV